MAEDAAVGRPERLHPLFLVTGIGGALRGMAGGYAFVGYLAVSGRLITALLSALGLFAMLSIGLLLYWRRFEYRVGANEIRIDSGIVSRTHRSIPYDRIQDVEIVQGPVARLLGLARVKFETGGSAGSSEDEGSLQAIALERAQQIRSLVRERRGQAAAAHVEEEAGPAPPPIFAMDTRRVLLAGLFNFSLALFAGLFGLTQTFGDLFGFDPLSRAFWAELLSAGDPIANFLMAHRVAAITAGTVLLGVAGVLTGLVRTVLREHGFRLDRTEAGLRRRRGLLTKSDVTVPSHRAQAAIIATGPVRDALGWSELRLQSLARDEGGSGDHVLAPLARDAEIGSILGELGWRPMEPDIAWQKVSKAYVWTLAVGLAPLLLLSAGFAAVLLLALDAAPETIRQAIVDDLTPLLAILLALPGAVLLAILTRWLAWRRIAWALDGNRLLIRTGWWRRRTIILPRGRIQSIDLAQSFVSRWFGAVALRFGVAGGRGFSAHAIPALDEEKARALREQLLSVRS